jgi:hypothetical protein
MNESRNSRNQGNDVARNGEPRAREDLAVTPADVRARMADEEDRMDFLKSVVFEQRVQAWWSARRLLLQYGVESVRKQLADAVRRGRCDAEPAEKVLNRMRAIEKGMTLRDYLEADSAESWLKMMAGERAE